MSIKEIILARNKEKREHHVAETSAFDDISIVQKIKYQTKAIKLSSFIIRQLKFNISFIKVFTLKVSERIGNLHKQENISLEKIYTLSLLKQELEKYIGE